jgi:hypothetical protein
MAYSDYNWFSVITPKDSFNETLKYLVGQLLDRDDLSKAVLVLDVLTKAELPSILLSREVEGYDNVEPISQARINPKYFAIDNDLYSIMKEEGVAFLCSPDLQDLSVIVSEKYILETIFHHHTIFCFLSDEQKSVIGQSYSLQPILI